MRTENIVLKLTFHDLKIKIDIDVMRHEVTFYSDLSKRYKLLLQLKSWLGIANNIINYAN